MQATVGESAWDFSQIFHLLDSLGSHEGISRSNTESQPAQTPLERPEPSDIQAESGLGDFNKLWDYLGVQRDAPATASGVHFETSSKIGGLQRTTNDAYASDGAIQDQSVAKERGWKSEGDNNPLDLTDPPTDPPMTKNQRKKHNRKLRAAAAKATQPLLISDREDDADIDEAKGESHAPQEHRYLLRNSKTSKPAPESIEKENNPTAVASVSEKDQSSSSASTAKQLKAATTALVPQATPQSINEAKNKVAAARANGIQSTDSKLHKTPSRGPNSSSSAKAIHESLQKHWSAGVGSNTKQYSLQTPTKQTTKPVNGQSTRQTDAAAAAAEPSLPFPVIETKPATRWRHEIQPLVNQTSVERNWALLLKLLHNFPEDKKYLVSPLQLSINRPQPSGIHVFVDASNILIGFYDHLKLSRGFPKEAKVARVDLNFHALALLLERRRPVAKRVLAGSTPELPAYEEARQVGYETCILDKVFKARELTEKQKRIKSRELHGPGYISGSESAGNGNYFAEVQHQEAKWVEQAVDEILHLKILESVVDTPIAADAVSPYILDKAGTSKQQFAATVTPPTRPTMVLATGDAAEAEYSPGFRKMVERALKSGWMVEVMAFGRSVSRDYRRMEKMPLAKGGWGERFKIIELDSYAEELFGESL